MSKANASAAGEPRESTAVRKPVILIVDDEFDITSTFSTLFRLRGFDTLTAGNGRHALEVMKERLPDIILSDCMMPIMDGLKFSAAVKSDATTAAIPIILMSAAPERHNMTQAGCELFLRKPVRFKEVIEAVLRLLAA